VSEDGSPTYMTNQHVNVKGSYLTATQAFVRTTDAARLRAAGGDTPPIY
jgi:hypothetical protein